VEKCQLTVTATYRPDDSLQVGADQYHSVDTLVEEINITHWLCLAGSRKLCLPVGLSHMIRSPFRHLIKISTSVLSAEIYSIAPGKRRIVFEENWGGITSAHDVNAHDFKAMVCIEL
jgi:hypothetical protein